jgi:hypothetical protein
MDYFKIAQAVFILIVFLIAVAAICYFMLQILYTGMAYFVKWLLGYKAVANFVGRIRRGIRMWYEKRKVYFISLWDFLSEVVISPLFWGYSIFALVTRIQSISDYAKVHPQYSFWQLLDLDMNADMSFYLIFIAVFIAWMSWRTWKHNQEVRYKKKLLKKLEDIEDAQKTLSINIWGAIRRRSSITRGSSKRR